MRCWRPRSFILANCVFVM